MDAETPKPASRLAEGHFVKTAHRVSDRRRSRRRGHEAASQGSQRAHSGSANKSSIAFRSRLATRRWPNSALAIANAAFGLLAAELDTKWAPRAADDDALLLALI